LTVGGGCLAHKTGLCQQGNTCSASSGLQEISTRT
jgi:hypothetical protein